MILFYVLCFDFSFADVSGYYCFQVPPDGKYKIVPLISKEEAEAGLLLTPNELTVTVNDAPVLEANFFQVRVLSFFFFNY
jgi:hypothetical protein